MSIQQNLTAIAGNDLKWHVQVTFNNDLLNLTAYTPLAILKASATALDSSGITYAIGTGLTWTNQAFGMFDWVIPHAATVPAGQLWYRIDVNQGSAPVTTALYGTLVLSPA